MEASMKFLDPIVAPRASTTPQDLSNTTPQIRSDGNIHDAIYGFGAVSLAITTISTVVRLFTKFYVLRLYRLDDFLMIGTWCVLVCMWAFIYVSIKYGAGDHLDSIPQSEKPGFLKLGYIHEILYSIAQGLLKTSICLQLLRIFVAHLSSRSRHRDWKFWAISIFAILQVIWFTVFFWIAIFQCVPVRRTWNPAVPGRCDIDWDVYNIVISTWNTTSDVLMLALPMACIWKLNMKTSIKISAGGVFVIGALAIAASVLRLIFTIRMLFTQDTTLVLTQIALCDTGEITAGMLSGNFVPIPKFYRYSRDVIRAIRNGDPVRHVRYKGSSNMSSTRPITCTPQVHNAHHTHHAHLNHPRDQTASLSDSSLSSELITFDDIMHSTRARPSTI